MKEKIGILGGTFHPVHNGHIKLAETALTQFGLDKVIFMPSGISYMKPDLNILPGEVRYHLIQLAIEGFHKFEVSDLEIKRRGNTYTYETLETLHAENPDAEYYFILGADCLFSMESWRNPQRIFDACRILAAARNGSDRAELEAQVQYLTDKFGARIQLLDFEETDISSSEIREKLAKGITLTELANLMPQKTAAYLLEHHLYV